MFLLVCIQFILCHKVNCWIEISWKFWTFNNYIIINHKFLQDIYKCVPFLHSAVLSIKSDIKYIVKYKFIGPFTFENLSLAHTKTNIRYWRLHSVLGVASCSAPAGANGLMLSWLHKLLLQQPRVFIYHGFYWLVSFRC